MSARCREGGRPLCVSSCSTNVLLVVHNRVDEQKNEPGT